MRDIILSEFGGTAHTYLAILEAIATGKTRRSEIAGPAGLRATSLSKSRTSTFGTQTTSRHFWKNKSPPACPIPPSANGYRTKDDNEPRPSRGKTWPSELFNCISSYSP